MDSGLYAAVNGALRTEMRLDVLANNLANVNTNGFKENNITFESFMTKPGIEQFPLPGDSFMGHKGPMEMPYPFINPASSAYSMSYPAAPSTTTDTTQGALKGTGNPLDVAIDGDGYFVINTPEGRRYTRDGSFQVNAAGELVTKDGHTVAGTGGGPIVIGSQAVEISQDGTIANASGQVGQLLRVGLPKEALKKMGHNLISAPQQMERGLAGARGGFKQGFLEASNTNTMRGMTQMIEANRNYENYMKIIQNMDSLDGQANQIGQLHG
ncbi:MAG: flagellar basal-body rod protein FlgF [Magnetococcales bacterium]|nr:flagellar basal-body rod protein FlgF [Magnetococcales bacterium]